MELEGFRPKSLPHKGKNRLLLFLHRHFSECCWHWRGKETLGGWAGEAVWCCYCGMLSDNPDLLAFPSSLQH